MREGKAKAVGKIELRPKKDSICRIMQLNPLVRAMDLAKQFRIIFIGRGG